MPTYILIAKLEGKDGWRILATNKDLEKLKLHAKNEMHATIQEQKYFKLNTQEGTIGRYFPN